MTTDGIKFIPDPVFFLAGPEEYIVSQMRELDSTKPMWVAVDGHVHQHPRVGTDFRWVEVCHSMAGGATGC